MRIPSLVLLLAFGCGTSEDSPTTTPNPGTPSGTTTVPDTTPPELVSIMPPDGGEAVGLGVAITARFSELLDPGSIDDGSIALETEDGVAVAGTTELYEDSLTFTPSADLLPARLYRVTLDPAIADLAGNPLGTVAPTTFQTIWELGSGHAIYLSYSEDRDQVLRTDFDGDTPLAPVEIGDPTWVAVDGVWYDRIGGVAIKADAGSGFELFWVHPMGGPIRKLSSGGEVHWAAWSPNGDQVAYQEVVSGTANQYNLRIAMADGSSDVLVAEDVGRIYMGWSPDSRSIAWVDDDTDDLYTAARSANWAPTQVAQNIWWGTRWDDPKWSPDSTRLAYVLQRAEIHVVPAAGGASTRVTPDSTWGAEGVDWISNDDLIWWGCTTCTTQTLYRSPAAGGTAVPLTENNGWALRYALSPARDQVAYFRDSPLGIYVASTTAATADEQMVSPAYQAYQGGGDMEPPVWSPTGDHVLYRARVDSVSPYQLRVVGADGSNPTQLTQLPDELDELGLYSYGFSPDGTRVFYGYWPRNERAQLRTSHLDGTSFAVVNTDPLTDVAQYQFRDAMGISQWRPVYDYWWF